ncbi:MAG: amino acid adenylation domain-containing protein, partial [bacterium]|nr:amino acid adenylation domain-containing protein [bacterium]
SPLGELAIQYADYAAWQRQWLSGEELERQLAYWRQQLAELPVLDLPCDRPRPALQSFRGTSHSFRLPAELHQDLHKLSREQGTTLFMTLLAAFQAFVGRTSGQADLAVGTAIANRNHAAIEDLVGFFVNTLVLRAELGGGSTFRELLGRVRETALGAFAHQDVPFEQLVEEIEPQRDLSHSPLFQVFFVLQNIPAVSLELAPELEVKIEGVATEIAKFDLTLSMAEGEAGLSGGLEYGTDLFDATTIRRMARQLGTLLEGAVADPERRLAELPLLTPAESHELVCEWRSMPASELGGGRLVEHFEAAAARRPEAIAVVSPVGYLSYGELNARANRLAAHLRGLGVGPEVVVGLFLERSPEALTAIFAVLKAGGAYLPLDPAYPRDRLAFMLDDAGAAVVVTRERPAPELPDSRAAVVRLDADGPAIAARSPQNPGRAGRASNLVYVIYTSGSTGRPKGVMLADRGLCGLVAGQLGYYGIGPRSRVVQFSSLSFDASVYEIFSTLAGGGTLCLGSTEELMPGPQLSRFLRRHAVTTWTVVPSALAVMADEELPALTSLTVAGEACSAELVERWAAGRRFINAYGPTENTVCASAAWIRERGEKPPIGRPFAASRLQVVDRRFELVPVGVPGELLIGGIGLARGYLGRPELTAERFVPDPWSDATRSSGGERLYRSGDLVRLLHDGQLEFLGRIDQQVKLRGFRIELGEVAAAVAAHPAVREAVATVRGQRLVAYAVPSAEAAQVRADELRARVARTLPDYMVPAAVVFLDSLPLTPSGKVDRAALDRQALPAPERAGVRLAPRGPVERDPVEEILAEIFAQLLEVDRVDGDDDFFELGGHSLLATQVVSQVRRQLRVELELRTLFEQPTVAGLAGEVTAALRREQGLEAPPIRPVPRRGHLPLSFAQERLWFIDRYEPGSALYNIPSVFHLQGRLDVGALARALAEIVRRHEILRTNFDTEGGRPVQRIRPEPELELPVLALDGPQQPHRRAEARRLALCEARRPFDLTREPLLRTALLRLGPRQHSLVLTVHHIAFDGWSFGVFLSELMTLYKAFSTGCPSPLPELRVQYADFAVWQRHWLSGEVLERQLAYWRQQLAELPVLELPTDRPRPVVQSFRGAAESFRLPGEPLNALSREQATTLFMTLLAVFQARLERRAGPGDLAVGSVVANRNRAEIEALLGFFVNTLVLRGDLRGDPRFHEHLARVRDVALGAYAHQDVPFEKLVEELAPQRDLSQNPLVQVLLVLQNAPMAPRDLVPGLRGSLEGVATGEAKFDLTVVMWEEEGALRGMAEYGTDLFAATTIRRLVGHFRNLAEGAVAHPGRRLSELPLLSAAEHWQLLGEWNETAAPLPAAATIPELFAAQRRRTPDALAVVAGERQLSYAELSRRADRLAHRLRALGVGPEVPVAICTERSPEMVVGVLAILKAGGAYLPIDPDYPEQRRAFMVRDAGVAVVLTRERWREEFGEVICLDGDALAEGSESAPASGLRPENPAYVIYTSGSTGLPKGTELAHRGLVNLVAWHQRLYGVTAADRATQLAAPGFDAAVWELWPYLTAGAAIHIADREIVADPARLPEWLVREGISLTFLPTPLAEAVLARPLPAGLRLRALL